jgi:hypothetical protein
MTASASKSPKTVSWRNVLPVHPAADLFPLMSEPELRKLGEDIKANGLLYPIVLRCEGGRHYDPGSYSLLDGRNRLDAMELVGIKLNLKFCKNKSKSNPGWFFGGDISVPVNYVGGDDPYGLVDSANILRRHLTAEQKRDLIGKLLKATPEKSDRQIAEEVKASPTTVGAVRHNMEETGDVSKLDTHFDSRGRNQPARKLRDPEKERIAREERKRQARGNVPPLEEVGSDEFLDDEGDFAAADLEADAAVRIEGFLWRAHQSAFGAETDHLKWLVCTGEMLEAAKAAAKAWNDVVALIETKIAEKSGAPVVANNDDGLDIPASLRRMAP